MKYTTIRISIEDKKRLKRLAKLLRYKNLTDALRFALSVAEKEMDKGRGDLDKVLSSLKHAKDIGKTNAEDIDKYLYGGE